MSAYAELQTTTNYSFLRGASSPEELFVQAEAYGLAALGVADHNSVAGIVRCWHAAKTTGVRLVPGCRLALVDGMVVLAYPQDVAAWSNLCQLLTRAKRAGKGCFDLSWDTLAQRGGGLLLLLVPQDGRAVPAQLARMRADTPGRSYLAASLRRRPGDAVRLRRLADLAQAHATPLVATGDVLFHVPARRVLQDVVTCIREGTQIDAAGFRRERHADRHLKPPSEMARLFARHPDALARSIEIVDRCRFDLGDLCYQYPDEVQDAALTPQQTLEHLTWAGAATRYPAARYPGGLPDSVAAQLRHELALIGQLDYAPYFLTVHTIVCYARDQGILCQGRGSAANSAVCYVLGITAIDPTQSNMLFERFVSAERREPPDIDVDFEHERREEVIQWVYEHYGRHRAALCATVIRYRSRGAVREVGKVLGLTEDVTGALASQVWGWSEEGVEEHHAAALNLNLDDRRLRLTLDLARELIGFPRHLGTHPGGFVLTRRPLAELVPVEPAAMKDRQVIEWDKDDIDQLHFMKVDVLGLGMLGCMRRAFDLLAGQEGAPRELADVPPEDPATFQMIQRADTLGTFQIESRAQMAMLPRMKPTRLYDLVIQVAIVRPGPIQGDMVHPYLRRREGLEVPEYPKPELRRVLEKTLGVPLFQEQAMQIAIVCAGFTPGESDQLRRAMATFKLTGGVSHFRDKLIGGMVANGYDRAFAEKTFSQIEGFGSYGFPESHAASFALIAYASAWMKCHHPDVFCCALLNSQPMGFYAPAQIVRDARDHGVAIHPLDVNRSGWDSSIEDGVRLGLRMAKGLHEAHGAAIVAGQPYDSIDALWRCAGVPVAALERLAEADAFGSLGLARRDALWAIRALAAAPLPLFAAADDAPEATEPPVVLIPMRPGREVVEDYGSVGLTLRRHPIAFLREELARRGMVTSAELPGLRTGRRVVVPGLVLVRQKPGSAKGVMFITTEDETGIANLIIWPSLFEHQRRLILTASMIACHGRVQTESGVTHVVADRLEDLSGLLRSVSERDAPWPLRHGRGDGATHPGSPDRGDLPAKPPLGRKARDIYLPESGPGVSGPGESGPGIKISTRDFR